MITWYVELYDEEGRTIRERQLKTAQEAFALVALWVTPDTPMKIYTDTFKWGEEAALYPVGEE